jgi:hypothetical protein
MELFLAVKVGWIVVVAILLPKSGGYTMIVSWGKSVI